MVTTPNTFRFKKELQLWWHLHTGLWKLKWYIFYICLQSWNEFDFWRLLKTFSLACLIANMSKNMLHRNLSVVQVNKCRGLCVLCFSKVCIYTFWQNLLWPFLHPTLIFFYVTNSHDLLLSLLTVLWISSIVTTVWFYMRYSFTVRKRVFDDQQCFWEVSTS